MLDLLGQFRPRSFEREAIFAGETAQHLHIIGAGRIGLGPGNDRALFQGERFVGDDELRVEFELFSQAVARSEEHTSELQSLMRISYAVFCLKKKNKTSMLN